MRTIGIVSPGAMGSAVANALARSGVRTVASVSERSERTRRLAARAGLELLPDASAVVGAADVVLSIVPPGEAASVADRVFRIAGKLGVRPLYADLNAISPGAVDRIASSAREVGLDVVDGSISGPPPWKADTTRVYLAGPRAHEIADLPFAGVDVIVVGSEIGAASAVKMSTASVYKGSSALLLQALLAAHANGVVEHVLADLRTAAPGVVKNVERRLLSAASKAERYVPEMREIATTQAAAGLTPELFTAIAAIYDTVARSELARSSPEDIATEAPLPEILDELRTPAAATERLERDDTPSENDDRRDGASYKL